MVNPSLDRQFTLTNFKWNLRTQGHLNAEKLGACNYLKLSRIPVDIRLYWNKTNNRETAFSLDELVRGFKIDDRDEAGNAKTLNNIFLWSEGEIPQEPLSDLIELEYNGEGAMITPLLGNKSGAIDKIEKVSVVSTLDRVLNPIKVVNTTNTQGYSISDFYRINANIQKPQLKYIHLYGNPLENKNVTFDYENASLVFTKNGAYLGNLDTFFGEAQEVKNPIKEGDILDKNLNLNKELLFGFITGNALCYQQNYGEMSNGGISNPIKRVGHYVFYKEWDTWLGYMEKGYFCKTPCLLFNNDLANFSVELLDTAQGVIKADCEVLQNESSPKKPHVFRSKSLLFRQEYETTYNEELALFIFKTQEQTSYIAPKQTQKSYISLIAQGETTKKADFNFLLREVSKTSAASEQPYLYMGGLSGIKIPVTNGFELAFNNKKSGLDYVVLEIPAGDIYKVELKLINVYEEE